MRRVLLVALVMSTAILSVAAGSTRLSTGRNQILANKFAPSGTHARYPDRRTQAAAVPDSIPPPVPTGSSGCPDISGTNVRVNQECTNQAAAGFFGRTASQNETSVAVNPTNPKNIVASQNDYHGGDATCGADFSLDGGRHWGSRLAPAHFTAPGFTAPRHYWDASGDTAVAFDSGGEAYLACEPFDRGPGVGDGGDFASGLYVFRSGDGGASWSSPGSIVRQVDGTDPTLALIDKDYMAIDSNRSSPYADRIYLSWSFYTQAQTADPIYVAYSEDHGNSWHQSGPISGFSKKLCPINYDGSPAGTCNANQFSNPFVAPNGDVFVAFQNFNNCYGAFGSPCSGDPNDNHSQMLIVKSTDGGNTFGDPVKVTDYYELPDCLAYTGQDPGRACVPTTPLSGVSIFRAVNYPTGVAVSAKRIVVDFGSYINRDSNSHKGNCSPAGFNPSTGLNLYKGVGAINGCNNDILRSVSTDGGLTFTGTSTPVGSLPAVSEESGVLTDQWWQWSAAGPHGRVADAYYDRRYGADRSTGFMDITLAAGASHTRVSNVSFPPSNEFPAANGYSIFMGDYNSLAVGSDGLAHPVWTDTRNPMFTYNTAPGSDPRPLVFAGYGADAYTRAVKIE
jgi:hypothetical protein